MLKVENISTGYGKKRVLYDISFEVTQGEIVLLTGGNGSGKSTILKTIYGSLALWEGSIYYKGEDLRNTKTSDLLKKGIVYIPQKSNLFENLTTHENLELSGSIYPPEQLKQRIESVYFEIPTLKSFDRRIPFNLSGGEKQLISCGMALIHNPYMILFDEPLAGLDSKYVELLSKKIVEINKNLGTTLLIVEHLKKLNNIANKELKLENGRLINT